MPYLANPDLAGPHLLGPGKIKKGFGNKLYIRINRLGCWKDLVHTQKLTKVLKNLLFSQDPAVLKIQIRIRK